MPASTTYKVRVVDGLNCVLEEQNIAILEPAELSFNVINTLTCGLDAFNQAISVTGLSGGNGLVANYTYQWTGPDNILLPSILNNINDTREGTVITSYSIHYTKLYDISHRYQLIVHGNTRSYW